MNRSYTQTHIYEFHTFEVLSLLLSVVSDAHMATSFCCCFDALTNKQTRFWALRREQRKSTIIGALYDGSNDSRPSSEHLPQPPARVSMSLANKDPYHPENGPWPGLKHVYT